jgi:hypothetical protein
MILALTLYKLQAREAGDLLPTSASGSATDIHCQDSCL